MLPHAELNWIFHPKMYTTRHYLFAKWVENI